MISYLINSFFIGILFADMLERRFPEQFRSFLTNVTFNTLYLYSKTQIYFARMNKTFNNFIEANPTLLKIKNELNSVMNDKRVVTLTQFIKNGEYVKLEDASNFDFALFSWLGDDNKCINKKIVYDINDPMSFSECSNIKFILIEIEAGEKKYKVNLKTDDYNFYVVGNKFTKQFFIYYLKQCLNINDHINSNDKIHIKIIDHNVDNIETDFTDKNESLVLEKTGYRLLSENQPDE
jgi:hypothetical protein